MTKPEDDPAPYSWHSSPLEHRRSRRPVDYWKVVLWSMFIGVACAGLIFALQLASSLR